MLRDNIFGRLFQKEEGKTGQEGEFYQKKRGRDVKRGCLPVEKPRKLCVFTDRCFDRLKSRLSVR